MQDEHYLKTELNELIKTDASVFDFIQESSLDGIYYWDLENPTEEWMSPKFWTTLGYDPEEMPHKVSAWQNIVNPRDLEVAQQKFLLHCQDPSQAFDEVFRFTHKDGSTVWVRCRGCVMRDGDGKPIRMLGAHQNITELKKNEEHLRILGSIAESPNTMILVTNAQRELTWANETFWQFVGYSKDEMLGKNPGQILQGPYPDMELRRNMSAALDAGEPFHCEIANYKKNGSCYWIDVNFQPVFDSEGALTHFVGVQHDVTQRKEAERKLKYHSGQFELAAAQATELAILADAASHSKSEFLANMNHEIRTPMNGVMGMTSLLLESDLSPLQRYQAEIISECADSLLAMMDNLLEVANLESSRLKLKLETFDLPGLLRECVESMSLPAEEKQLELKLEIPDELPQMVIGHPGRIRQILNNLLGNAIKFTEIGEVVLIAKIEFSEIQDDSAMKETQRFGLILEVKDTGIGIPEDKIPGLFSPFSQVDTSTTRKHGGTGLGLAICRQSVELMGGSIEVDSVLGEGSTFRVMLPVDTEAINLLAEAAKLSETEAHSAAVEEGERVAPWILLAEDLSLNQMVTKELLATLGMQVDVVKNGLEVIHAFSRMHYDLILMDLQMPKMDGYEATRAIREIEKKQGVEDSQSIPIVALTAHALESDRNACLAAGMDDYIAKPVHLGKLKKVIREWLSRKSGSNNSRAQVPVQSDVLVKALAEKVGVGVEALVAGIEETNLERVLQGINHLKALPIKIPDKDLEVLLAQIEEAARFALWDLAGILSIRVKSIYEEISGRMERVSVFSPQKN